MCQEWLSWPGVACPLPGFTPFSISKITFCMEEKPKHREGKPFLRTLCQKRTSLQEMETSELEGPCHLLHETRPGRDSEAQEVGRPALALAPMLHNPTLFAVSLRWPISSLYCMLHEVRKAPSHVHSLSYLVPLD